MREKSYLQDEVKFFDKVTEFLRFNNIKKYIEACDVLIDAGCGYKASFLRWIASRVDIKKLIGLDVSVSEDVFNEKISFKKCDLNGPIDITSESADIITSLAVLEHLDKPQENLCELYRILRNDGKLVLTVPSPLSKPDLEFMAFKLKIINKAEILDHKSYFTHGQLFDMLIKAGFKKDKVKIKNFTFGLNTSVVAFK